MSHKYKTQEGKVYFVTLTVVGWIDIFTRKDYVEELINNIQYCQKNKDLNVYAYVIMPNHLHTICSRESKTVNELLRDFKSFTSKKLISMVKQHPGESRKEWLMHMFKYFGKGNPANEVFQFWENGSHPIELNSPEILRQKMDYINMNPERRDLLRSRGTGNIAVPMNFLKSEYCRYSSQRLQNNKHEAEPCA